MRVLKIGGKGVIQEWHDFEFYKKYLFQIIDMLLTRYTSRLKPIRIVMSIAGGCRQEGIDL